MTEARIKVQPDPDQSTDRIADGTQFEYPTAATLTGDEVCACIEDTGVIPSVGRASLDDVLFIADALA